MDSPNSREKRTNEHEVTFMDAKVGKQHNRNFFRFAFESFLLSPNKMTIPSVSVGIPGLSGWMRGLIY